ncbi:MAG: pyridoxal phosphate-dependent aminotransferase family protein [Chitinispirillaceae bacterium]|nr:pyridoxal phosphate-dependent aminotransferase family protein [Chitinispirillaceae bacterium]
MTPERLYTTLAPDLSLAEKIGFNPYYQKITRGGQGKLTIAATGLFDLASNDYLGLATDPRVTAAMSDASHRYGASFCGTPIAAGYAAVLAELESALAGMTGCEAAVIFPSCYQANCSLFGSIADARDAIIVDHYAHASLVQGIRSSGARVKPFLHNDLDHLEKQLAASTTFRRLFVVTESVFSTEGSIAPFDRIVRLCRRYHAVPIIDDSHGIGVIGKGGRGVLEHCDIRDFDGIYTASLGKALANTGGVIAGRRALIDYLRYTCPGLIYSTALVPASAAGLLAALAIVIHEFPRLGKTMWSNHQKLVTSLNGAGFSLKAGEAPIASVMCGPSETTLACAKQLFEQGILSTPFIPPSVPENQGVVRLIIGAKTDDAGMEQIGERIMTAGQRTQA